mmetsp:Transcript_97623/g.173882  ORF Transcript_97623/g.173882 Transcript_97623/m.173882 type:complete len:314 (+) Transcript_97623:83-1024(+)
MQGLLALHLSALLAAVESQKQCLDNPLHGVQNSPSLLQTSRLQDVQVDMAALHRVRDHCLTQYIDKVNSASSGFTLDSMKQIIRSQDRVAKQSERKLVLCAGQGTTATVGVAFALEALHLHGYHWTHEVATANENVLKGELPAYVQSIWDMLQSGEENCRAALAEYDFTTLPSDVDYVSDTPFPETFLVFYQQFPQAKVILSTRPAAEWVQKRRAHSGTPAPVLNPCGAGSIGNYSDQQLEIFFDAYNELVRCVVPQENLLEIDAISKTIDMPEEFLQFLSNYSLPSPAEQLIYNAEKWLNDVKELIKKRLVR